jgi:hypothetical protein
LAPQPGNTRARAPRNAEEYGYIHGDVLGGSGYIRVEISGKKAKVDYILAVLPRDETASRRNGAAAHSYAIEPGF